MKHHNKIRTVISLTLMVLVLSVATYQFNWINAKETDQSFFQKRIKPEPVSLKEFNQLPRNDYPSILITNLHGSMYADNNNLNKYGVATNIFDVSYIVYQKEFAKLNGYPLSEEFNDATLDPNLKAVEFSVITDGSSYRCELKLLVDKKLNIDFPNQDLTIRSMRNGDRMRFPKIDKDQATKAFDALSKKEQEELADFREKVKRGEDYRYNMNVLFGYGNQDIASAGSASLREFSPRYFKDANYLKLDMGCTELTRRVLKSKQPTVWIKKKGGKDYSELKSNKSINPNEFYQLSLPKKIAQKIIPVMEMTDPYFPGNEGLILIKN